MLEFRVRARVESRLGPGLETPGVRNVWVRKDQGIIRNVWQPQVYRYSEVRRIQCKLRKSSRNNEVKIVRISQSFGLSWEDRRPHSILLQRVRMARHAECCTSQSNSVCLSDRLSVRPSDTLRYCVQTNEDTIVRLSASGRTIPLVSGQVKFIRIFAGVAKI